jgi:hypothetical protein
MAEKRLSYYGLRVGLPCKCCLRIVTQEVIDQKRASFLAKTEPHYQERFVAKIDMELAKQMRDEGCSFGVIGQEFGVTATAVRFAFLKWTGSTESLRKKKERRGRPPGSPNKKKT